MLNNPDSRLQQNYTQILFGESSFPHQSSGNFRPSEASVELHTPYGPRIEGACARKTWYRLTGTPSSEGQNLPHQIQRMHVGKGVEEAVIERCKRAGLYVANNIPFSVKMSGVQISGELDAVLRTTPCGPEKYLLEIKSIYGYPAQKSVFGKYINVGRETGKPKHSYIMQTALYLNHFSRLSPDDPSYLPYGAIFVCDRGDGHFCVFEVWLEDDVRILNEDETIRKTKICYASSGMNIDKQTLPYTVEDILQRYRYINHHLEINTPPPRDFVKAYNEEQIDVAFKLGQIGKARYEAWKASHGPRGKGVVTEGDWNCQPTYCPWSSCCESMKE